MTSYSPEEQRAIEEAATWYARLLPGAASLPDNADASRDFAQWLSADPNHVRAWETVQAMGERMARMPSDIAKQTLGRPNTARRTVLRSLVVALVGSGTFVVLKQTNRTPAQYATAAGERRTLTLPDGSILNLDTRTALDVHFGAAERRLHLREGVILVSTHPDTAVPSRPFFVDTPEGRIVALGTRFEVRSEKGATTVSVLEDAVLVTRAGSPDVTTQIDAGQRLRFTRLKLDPVQERIETTGIGAWTAGQLIVWEQRLADVAAELARYQRGWLSCDPAVAELRISGVLPLDDIDQALAALADGFPVRIHRQWGGWRVRIGPR